VPAPDPGCGGQVRAIDVPAPTQSSAVLLADIDARRTAVALELARSTQFPFGEGSPRGSAATSASPPTVSRTPSVRSDAAGRLGKPYGFFVTRTCLTFSRSGGSSAVPGRASFASSR
jgi:hypothetical protein